MSIVVFVSGNGSNLQALIDAKFNIRLVLSNKNCPAIERAKRANIATEVCQRGREKRMEFDKKLAQIVIPYYPRAIVLAGFMHILSKEFLDSVKDCAVINVQVLYHDKYKCYEHNLHPLF